MKGAFHQERPLRCVLQNQEEGDFKQFILCSSVRKLLPKIKVGTSFRSYMYWLCANSSEERLKAFVTSKAGRVEKLLIRPSALLNAGQRIEFPNNIGNSIL